MTKEQILSSLKPLEWAEVEDDDNHKFIAITQFGNYTFYNFHALKLNHETIGYYDADLGQAAAQEHYNNLVLELFNLEVR